MLTALLLCFALTAGASDIPSFDSRFIKEAEFETALLSTSEEYRSLFAASLFAEIALSEFSKDFSENLGQIDYFGGMYYVELEYSHGVMIKFGNPSEVWTIVYTPDLKTISVIISKDISTDILSLVQALEEKDAVKLYKPLSVSEVSRYLKELVNAVK